MPCSAIKRYLTAQLNASSVAMIQAPRGILVHLVHFVNCC